MGRSLKLDDDSTVTEAITIGSGWRAAMDRPVQELGDYLRYRLGVKGGEDISHVSNKIEVDLSGISSDELSEKSSGELSGDASDDSSDESSDESSDGVVYSNDTANQGVISTKDVVDLLRKCDPFDVANVLQQVSNMNSLVPIYFNRSGSKEEQYLKTKTHRYLTYKVKLGKKGDFSHQDIPLASDVNYPRVVFASLNKDGSKKLTSNVIKNIFEKVSPDQCVEEDKDGAVSIEVGLTTVLDSNNDDWSGRRVWMLFHIKGCDFLQNEQTHDILKNADIVLVQVDKSTKNSADIHEINKLNKNTYVWYN